VLRLQLGGHPMLVRVASTAAQDEAQACPASTSMQPDPGTSSLKHPSVVTQIWPKPQVSGELPPASAPGQSALGGGHWNVRLGEHVPPPLEPELDEDPWLEPLRELAPLPELAPEPDDEPWPEMPELAPEREPDPELLVEPVPAPPFELLPQATPQAARASAATSRKDVAVRIGQALARDERRINPGSRESRPACQKRSLRRVQRRSAQAPSAGYPPVQASSMQ